MKRIPWMQLTLLLIFSSVLFISCNKEGGNCFTNSGPVIEQNRIISDFDSIRLLDNVSLILSPGTENKVVVVAGQNIIDGIRTEVVNRELVIRNNNSCNWLRSYSKPLNVKVTVKNLLKLYYESSGNVTCTDTIRSGSLAIDLWGGCGMIDLDLNIYQGYFIQHLGTATLTLNGKCGISNVFAGNYGLLQLKNLRTGYTFVTNNSSNDCYVSAGYELDATITSIGNIIYSGDPKNIKYKITGKGKLIAN